MFLSLHREKLRKRRGSGQFCGKGHRSKMMLSWSYDWGQLSKQVLVYKETIGNVAGCWHKVEVTEKDIAICLVTSFYYDEQL